MITHMERKTEEHLWARERHCQIGFNAPPSRRTSCAFGSLQLIKCCRLLTDKRNILLPKSWPFSFFLKCSIRRFDHLNHNELKLQELLLKNGYRHWFICLIELSNETYLNQWGSSLIQVCWDLLKYVHQIWKIFLWFFSVSLRIFRNNRFNFSGNFLISGLKSLSVYSF